MALGNGREFLDVDSKKAASLVRAAIGTATLPFLEDFRRSVTDLQKVTVGRNVRRYCADILEQGFFEVVSPLTGKTIRSGVSLVLVDKTVVFSFPEQSTLFIGSGDLGRGYPLCAAIILEPGLWIELERTDWGFARRHLDEFFALSERLAWRPAPASEPPVIVTGDSNFAHHAWNQLSPLHDLASAGWRLDGFPLIATHLPLGPLDALFPELALTDPEHVTDARLPEHNHPRRTCVTLGGELLQEGLGRRVLDSRRLPQTDEARRIKESVDSAGGAVLWMSIRTRNRTMTNQEDVLSSIGGTFLDIAPNTSVIIDGHSTSEDLEAEGHEAAQSLVASDLRVANAIAARLRKNVSGAQGRIHLAVGLPIGDSIWLSQAASVYFAHHGTVQHKIGWFNATPGMVHCNRDILAANPAGWVAAQSDVAIRPQYVTVDLVVDAEHARTQPFGELLKTNNYTITDVPRLAEIFARFASQHIPATKQAGLTMFSRLKSALLPSAKVGPRGEAPPTPSGGRAALDPQVTALVRRHQLETPSPLEPSGPLYTDFFSFVNALLKPAYYFEVGTERGRSVAQFTCDAVCVDPNFILERDIVGQRRRTLMFQMTSDDFFAQNDLRTVLGASPDVCFLDGMHWAEFLLRDFMNTERACRPDSVLFLHDCLPSNERMARRAHEIGDPSEGKWQHAWTGDVWKVVPALKKYRPDLRIFLLDCAPTGLVAISGIDPESRILAEHYGEAVRFMDDLSLSSYTLREIWNSFPVLSSQSLMNAGDDFLQLLS